MAHTTTATLAPVADRALLNEAYKVGISLGRKFEDSDIINPRYGRVLMPAATNYVASYVGDFEYIAGRDGLASKLIQYGQLSVGQARGALNTMMADARKRMEAKAPATTPAARPTAQGPVTQQALDMRKVADGRYRVVLADTSSISVRVLSGVWDDEPTSRQVAILADGQKWFGLGKAREDGSVQIWRKAADAAPRVREALEVLANADSDLAFRLAFALVGSQCSFCGLALDTQESITAGYGPTCAAKRDLPWGDKAVVPASVQAARAAAAAMVAGQVPATYDDDSAQGTPERVRATVQHNDDAVASVEVVAQVAAAIATDSKFVTLAQAKERGYSRSYEEIFGDD